MLELIMATINACIHTLQYDDIPASAQHFAKRCLLDLVGVAAGGTHSNMSAVGRDYAAEHLPAGPNKVSHLLFDGRSSTPAGAAFANANTIDSLDAHDGHKLTKGHVGCGTLAALLAFTEAEKQFDGREFLTRLVLGYEIGTRAGISLHSTACDYHTSGAWVALSAAAIGARSLGLNQQTTREALGIAEFNGPRSQMMRCVDHPTMIRDGSGWGSHTGVSAAYMAQLGFTGAPAITCEADEVAGIWQDLGEHWIIQDQYFKAYPVCRWAQPAIEATLILQREHNIDADTVASIEVTTFHEAIRLHTIAPDSGQSAQYSLPFPLASALYHRELNPAQVQDCNLDDPAVLDLASRVRFKESDSYNEAFPARRIAHVSLTLIDGRTLTSPPTEARGDPEAHLDDAEIRQKFFNYCSPVITDKRSTAITHEIDHLDDGRDVTALLTLLSQHPDEI